MADVPGDAGGMPPPIDFDPNAREIEFDAAKRRDLAAALLRAKVTKPCPRCESYDFSIVDRFGAQFVSKFYDFDPIRGSEELSVVYVCCDQCGWLSMHASSVLGFPKR